MRRKYSDREKAEALAVLDANSGNLTKTAEMLEIPIKTLSDWRDGLGVVDDVAVFRIEEKRSLADKLDDIAHQCAGLLPGMLPEANVREVVGAMGQSIEKSLLLRGQPTQITKTFNSALERLRGDLPGVNEGDVKAYLAELLGQTIEDKGVIA